MFISASGIFEWENLHATDWRGSSRDPDWHMLTTSISAPDERRRIKLTTKQ